MQDGAEADAYKLTHCLLKKWISKELQVYDNTEIITIRHHKHEIELIAANKKKIRAKKLILACGYESQQYIPKKVQELQATYAIASEPFAEKNFWYRNALIWETATSYMYLRTTSDNRILMGGKDIPFSNPVKRDSLLMRKAWNNHLKNFFPVYYLKQILNGPVHLLPQKTGFPILDLFHKGPTLISPWVLEAMV